MTKKFATMHCLQCLPDEAKELAHAFCSLLVYMGVDVRWVRYFGWGSPNPKPAEFPAKCLDDKTKPCRRYGFGEVGFHSVSSCMRACACMGAYACACTRACGSVFACRREPSAAMSFLALRCCRQCCVFLLPLVPLPAAASLCPWQALVKRHSERSPRSMKRKPTMGCR